jgi:type I restriction enzyme R subunit
VRKVIIEESQTNPKYYERMSVLLNELIQQRKDETLAYQEYLQKITELARNLSNSGTSSNYPTSLNSQAKRALYDNLDQNEALALELDARIHQVKNEGWRDGGIKEKKVRLAVYTIIQDDAKTEELMKIIKAQNEY